ncbi:serine hydrolase domain-containing protein [Saccharothrix australiensis]|uniref:CubicO group peptidase (Beta-lactamase class C family) n=1 Tax=Saccharothrix australiensis TaxID=2072 RepID=A0A495VS03_9PSEU|nr:serine hydrolase domain-containing protein [Saccharothrix australiensis]RKT52129.1 CubicO group peptidase (beta-lactamase class C family) [Saccharothrix australiensis]
MRTPPATTRPPATAPLASRAPATARFATRLPATRVLTTALLVAALVAGTTLAPPGAASAATPGAARPGGAGTLTDPAPTAPAGPAAPHERGDSSAQAPPEEQVPLDERTATDQQDTVDERTPSDARDATDGHTPPEAPGAADRDERGRFDVPRRGWSNDVLRTGTPGSVGLDPGPVDAALEQVRRHTEPGETGHPLYAGAVALLAHDGVITHHTAAGWAVRYADAAGTELPGDRRVAMTPDTIFDLASISKLFTSIVVMREQERGRLDLDARVARYLPEFGVNGKAAITVEQLLTHTSGLEPWLPLWSDHPDVPARIKAVMDVAPKTSPGTAYAYSDLNLITLGVLVERITGKPLDVLVREGITEPLGLTDTGYRPPRSKLDRIAATEFQAARGLVRGEVHDENAWSLGGVAGHAGVFSTARDLATLGQAILNGGAHGHRRVLRPETVEAMLTDFNQDFPGNAHGLGFELDQRWYMGALSSPRTAGHTGFTGTALVLDPLSGSIAVLLTNRVHPNRDRGSINPARRAVANGLAHALGVRPRRGPTAWTPTADGGTLTTGHLRGRSARQRLEFSVFADLDAGDRVVVQASDDGVAWRDVETVTGHGDRRWRRVDLVTASAARYRWLFVRGDGYGGRGAYVDAVRVSDARGVLVDAEHDPSALHANGWRSATR